MPAREATQAPPRAVLVRSHVERRARRALPRLAVAGLAILLFAGALTALSSKSLVLSFAAIFLFVLGYACLVPGTVYLTFRVLPLAAGDPEEVWRSFFLEDAVIVSEPYAYHRDLAVGDLLELLTDRGPSAFAVAGMYYDYASDRGIVAMHRRTFDRHWDDPAVQSMGLFAAPGTDAEELAERVRRTASEAAGGQQVTVAPNRALCRAALEIFDRTFLITAVLRLLAVGVAFIGILSALMALQLERARELGVLRANGLTPVQVWGLVTGQTALMGLASGLLAVPLGVALATLLIEVINRRPFGWTLRMDLDAGVLLQAVLLALAAALLAGLYPAFKMSRSSPALALREE